jgi:bacteriochlorophyll 4-vinyl reductase
MTVLIVAPHAGSCGAVRAPDRLPGSRLRQGARLKSPIARADAAPAAAGRLAADCLLAHRFPSIFERLRRRLPKHLGGRVFFAAIRGRAWMSVRCGRLAVQCGTAVALEIAANPFGACEHALAPGRICHAAVFQRLFAVFSPAGQVRETACEAQGDPFCRLFRMGAVPSADWMSERD